MKRKLVILSTLILTSSNALAESFNDFMDQTKVDGNIRLYDFNRGFGKSGNPSQSAFSLGGALNILTGDLFIAGLQAGAAFYTAQNLGLNSNDPAHVDRTLPGHTVNTLGQTYLQYSKSSLLIRAGNQIINTPWISAADTRIIPATYQGLFTSYSPWQDFTLTALRIYRFKSRTANNFTRSNLYNPGNYGGTTAPGYDDTATPGALALGSTYKKTNFTGDFWYYKFYDLANLLYANGKYQFNKDLNVTSFVAVQAVREWGDGDNLLSPYLGGSANADVFGFMAGAQFSQVNLSLAYNNEAQRNHSFKQGNILSPYTSGYSSDPLYTTSMLGGLVEKSSGQAVKFSTDYLTINKTWKLSASYAKYFTTPQFANSTEVDLDGSYQFNGHLKGLSLRDRIGILNGIKATGRVLQNRLMLQYQF